MYETDRYVKLRFGIYKSMLIPYVKQDKKILDIGCYMADILKVLPFAGNYYGIDSDEVALEIARQRGANIMKLNLENDQIPLDEKFDVIISTELLEHLKDPEKLVIQLERLLDKNGVVLISLPNECTIYHRFKVMLGKGIDGTAFAPHYHLHFPTIKQNDEFIEKHFKILERRFWFHLGITPGTEKFLSKIPDKFWFLLINLFPSLFARGVIYLCKLK